MKYFAYLPAAVLALTASAVGGPLRKADISADAKWVLHLDVDQLRSTSAGKFVITEIADKVLAEPKAKMKQDTGYDLDLSKVKSVTAYGTYTERVLLLKGDIDAERLLDGAMARIQKEGKSDSAAVEKTVQGGLTTYRLRDRMVVTLRPDKVIVASQSAEANEKANDVLSGKAPNLASGRMFKEFPEPQKGFFFLGVAEGFNAGKFAGDSEEGDQNNPKAKILKMADGGRIILGQDDDQLFLNVALKAKTTAVVTQMQQVIQGMIALAALAKSDNTNIQQLAESAKVSTHGDVVTLNLSFPADEAMTMLKSKAAEKMEQVERRHPRSDREHKAHSESKAQPESEEK